MQDNQHDINQNNQIIEEQKSDEYVDDEEKYFNGRYSSRDYENSWEFL